MASALAPIISTPYFSSDAGAVEGHGGVQRGLAAERGEEDELVRLPVGRRRACVEALQFLDSRTMIFSTHSGVMGSM